RSTRSASSRGLPGMVGSLSGSAAGSVLATPAVGVEGGVAGQVIGQLPHPERHPLVEPALVDRGRRRALRMRGHDNLTWGRRKGSPLMKAAVRTIRFPPTR